MEFFHGDSIEWLKEQPDASLDTVITGIPDLSEITDYTPDNMENYRGFVAEVVQLLAAKVRPDQFIIFIQTDRRRDGVWIDKAFEIQTVMKSQGVPLRFHKIIINKKGIDLYRVGFSHVLAFSRSARYSKRMPDIFEAGFRLWANATPLTPVVALMELMQRQGVRRIIDPFAGLGTVGLVANIYGIRSWNIELDPGHYKEMKRNYKSPKFQKALIGRIFGAI